jgi:hypothetical protein
MPNDPFKPPKTDANDKAAAPGSPLRAVLTGLAVDIGGSILAGIVLSFFYHSQIVASGLTPDQVDAAMDDMPMDSPFAMLGIVLGAACSVLGGYVCARIVRRDEFRVGAVMAALSASLSMLGESSSTPDDLVLLLTVSTAACVLLGVKFGREANRRPPPPAPPTTGEPRP